MTTTAWIRALSVTALLASACGSVPATGNANSSSTPAFTPNPTPTTASSAPAPTYLALVTLRGTSSYVVRDITDIGHPKTVSNLGTIPAPQFVSASELSYANDSGLVRVPLAGFPKTVVSSKASGLFAWSPDESTVVFTTQTDSGMDLHQLSAGDDRVMGSMPASGVGGCESIAGCAIANSIDFRLSYSPDGTVVSMVTNGFGVSVFRLWSSDGKVLKSSDSQGTTMSVWSGASFFFRDAKGVEGWREGLLSSFLPGVVWIRPKASPDGSQIVYAARDSNGWAHTYVVDTATRKVRELKSARAEPVFLTSRYIWYAGERACVPADACGSKPPFHPLSGKTYIYDLQDGTETESIITSVADVWPHAA